MPRRKWSKPNPNHKWRHLLLFHFRGKSTNPEQTKLKAKIRWNSWTIRKLNFNWSRTLPARIRDLTLGEYQQRIKRLNARSDISSNV